MDKKTKKKIIQVIVLIALVIIAVLVFIFKPTEIQVAAAPDPMEMSSDDIGKFMGSREFNALTLEERADFIEQIPGGQKARLIHDGLRNFDDEKGRRQFRDKANAYVTSRVETFEKASPAEQAEMLEQDAKRFDTARRMIRMSGNKQIIPQSGAERTEFDASVNPATKAKMRVYLERIRQKQNKR